MDKLQEGIARDPAVSLEELDLSAVTGGEDRGLTVEVIWREKTDDGSGRIVAREDRRFPIRSNLAIPMMTSLLRLETQINDALSEDDEEADKQLSQALTRSHNRIVALITDRTPDAFDERELEGRAVVGSIELDTSQILVTLAWISGDTSVAEAVAKTLSAGASGSKTAEELAAEAAEAAERGEPLEESGAPLASRPAS